MPDPFNKASDDFLKKEEAKITEEERLARVAKLNPPASNPPHPNPPHPTTEEERQRLATKEANEANEKLKVEEERKKHEVQVAHAAEDKKRQDERAAELAADKARRDAEAKKLEEERQKEEKIRIEKMKVELEEKRIKQAAEKRLCLEKAQLLLVQYNGLESNIPLDSEYWGLMNRHRAL